MLCSEERAVTPELELAKLALVTSKDEEDDEQAGQHPSVISQIGDPTVGPLPPSILRNDTSPVSVLGKRPGDALEREARRTPPAMDVDSPVVSPIGVVENDGDLPGAASSLQRSATMPASWPGTIDPTAVRSKTLDILHDVEMTDATSIELEPPALEVAGTIDEKPKPKRQKSMIQTDGGMMFGEPLVIGLRVRSVPKLL